MENCDLCERAVVKHRREAVYVNHVLNWLRAYEPVLKDLSRAEVLPKYFPYMVQQLQKVRNAGIRWKYMRDRIYYVIDSMTLDGNGKELLVAREFLEKVTETFCDVETRTYTLEVRLHQINRISSVAKKLLGKPFRDNEHWESTWGVGLLNSSPVIDRVLDENMVDSGSDNTLKRLARDACWYLTHGWRLVSSRHAILGDALEKCSKQHARIVSWALQKRMEEWRASNDKAPNAENPRYGSILNRLVKPTCAYSPETRTEDTPCASLSNRICSYCRARVCESHIKRCCRVSIIGHSERYANNSLPLKVPMTDDARRLKALMNEERDMNREETQSFLRLGLTVFRKMEKRRSNLSYHDWVNDFVQKHRQGLFTNKNTRMLMCLQKEPVSPSVNSFGLGIPIYYKAVLSPSDHKYSGLEHSGLLVEQPASPCSPLDPLSLYSPLNPLSPCSPRSPFSPLGPLSPYGENCMDEMHSYVSMAQPRSDEPFRIYFETTQLMSQGVGGRGPYSDSRWTVVEEGHVGKKRSTPAFPIDLEAKRFRQATRVDCVNLQRNKPKCRQLELEFVVNEDTTWAEATYDSKIFENMCAQDRTESADRWKNRVPNLKGFDPFLPSADGYDHVLVWKMATHASAIKGHAVLKRTKKPSRFSREDGNDATVSPLVTALVMQYVEDNDLEDYIADVGQRSVRFELKLRDGEGWRIAHYSVKDTTRIELNMPTFRSLQESRLVNCLGVRPESRAIVGEYFHLLYCPPTCAEICPA